MRRALVAGNWKMNGTLGANRELLASLRAQPAPRKCEVVVCPPYPYLALCVDMLKGSVFRLGAQNMHAESAGAYTGEVSGTMLRDFGCEYVILGHSERRRYCAESDALVAHKAEAALREGLVPIVCIGETQEERNAQQAFAVVGRQMQAVMSRLGVDGLARIVVAYEPVWAIGTGITASPQQAQEMHRYVRGLLAEAGPGVAGTVRILYGGSVNASNAWALFREADIDGALVGGASLKANEFAAICRAAEEN